MSTMKGGAQPCWDNQIFTMGFMVLDPVKLIFGFLLSRYGDGWCHIIFLSSVVTWIGYKKRGACDYSTSKIYLPRKAYNTYCVSHSCYKNHVRCAKHKKKMIVKVRKRAMNVSIFMSSHTHTFLSIFCLYCSSQNVAYHQNNPSNCLAIFLNLYSNSKITHQIRMPWPSINVQSN